MNWQCSLGIVSLGLLFVGCNKPAAPVPTKAATVPVTPQAPPIDAYKQFKNAARMALEDIQKPVTPMAFKDTWKLVSEQYQALRIEGKAQPASDVYDRLDILRVGFDLHWQEIAISQGPWDHSLFKEDIAKIEKLNSGLR
jgi:hypothetical protein